MEHCNFDAEGWGTGGNAEAERSIFEVEETRSSPSVDGSCRGDGPCVVTDPAVVTAPASLDGGSSSSTDGGTDGSSDSGGAPTVVKVSPGGAPGGSLGGPCGP